MVRGGRRLSVSVRDPIAAGINAVGVAVRVAIGVTVGMTITIAIGLSATALDIGGTTMAVHNEEAG